MGGFDILHHFDITTMSNIYQIIYHNFPTKKCTQVMSQFGTLLVCNYTYIGIYVSELFLYICLTGQEFTQRS